MGITAVAMQIASKAAMEKLQGAFKKERVPAPWGPWVEVSISESAAKRASLSGLNTSVRGRQNSDAPTVDPSKDATDAETDVFSPPGKSDVTYSARPTPQPKAQSVSVSH